MIEYFNEDCMIGMVRYPDKYFDLAIVDPPYGIGISSNPVRQAHTKKQWDSNVPDLIYFEELKRVSKNQIIWGGNYYDLPPTQNYIVWNKLQPIDFSLAMCELAWCSIQKPIKMFTYSVLTERNKIHPTQKPVALYKWLLKNYAKEGDLILDTHVGSASSLIACHDLGFDAVGFELDEDYYKASKQRLKDHMAQMRIEDMSNHISGEDDKPEQITLW